MVLGNSYTSADSHRKKLEEKLRQGYDPRHKDREGIRFIAPLTGEKNLYKPGDVYDSPWGEVRMYNKEVAVINEQVYNKHVSDYKRENARIKKMTEDFVSAGDEVFIHYMGKDAYDFLASTTAGWSAEVKAALRAKGLEEKHLDKLIPFDARPSILDVINPKSEAFQLGMLKLANVIRYSSFVFDRPSDADLPQNPLETANQFAATP